jgi:phospholipase C
MRRIASAVVLALLVAACAGRAAEPLRGERAPFDHVVVLFLENRSFDHLFGTYPGADGLANYKGRQADKNGQTYTTLPAPLGRDGKPDPRLPAELPNAPFPFSRFVASLEQTNNPVHRFYHMQRQYGAGADGVPMGKWVAEGTSGGTSMGYYDRAASPVQWRLADEFVLLDRYFQSIHGGSFANHYFLITGAVAHVGDDPEHRAVAGPDGQITKDGEVTPDGFVVNNLDPPYPPQRVKLVLKTPQTRPTIGDRLDARSVSWRWYAGGWGGGADAVRHGLIPHYNPFQYFKGVMESETRRARIADSTDFVRAVRAGDLPSVAWVKPPAKDTGHPNVSTVGAGDRFVGDMVREIMQSRYWPRVVLVITYDEGGGWFDHVRPPVVDRFGLGTRVPALVVSPYARRGVVGHGQYDHASILKLIEWRWGLPPLTERDRAADAFLEAFDFTQTPRAPVAMP